MANSPLESNLRLLEKLVKIHSGPGNIAGVERVQTLVKLELERLGFNCRLVARAGAQSGPMLIGDLRGRLSKTIAFVSHADTLEPGCKKQSRFEIAPDGIKAFGAGVIDDKGGIVVALDGLKRYLNALMGEPPEFSLRFICSPNEEWGSPGFQDLLKDQSRECVIVLGFEPSLDDGSIIDSRRGNRWYKIDVKGTEAHSGRGHRQGANAAHELAIKIAEMHKLTDYKKHVTLSVGHVEGGLDSYNIVCGHASAKVDTRFPTFDARDRLHRRIVSILKKTHVHSHADRVPTETSFEIADDCPPFAPTSGSKDVIGVYLKKISRIEGRKVKSKLSGGGADSCYMSRVGLIVMDGLGPTGAGLHTPSEFLVVASLETRARALYEFLLQLPSEL